MTRHLRSALPQLGLRLLGLPLLGLLACATPAALRPPVPTPTTDFLAAETEACGNLPTQSVSLPAEAPTPLVVRAVGCAGRVERAPQPGDRWYVRRHLEYDERTTPPLTVAAMIVACVADGGCDPAVDPESFGVLHAYAQNFQVAPVEQAMAKRFPPQVEAAFLARLRNALRTLDEGTKRLDDRRRALYVEVPQRIRAERLAHADAVAPFAEKAQSLLLEIDTTLVGIPSAETLAELSHDARSLREDALLHCTARLPLQDCLDGAVIRPLSDRVVQLAIRQKDAPLAAAENAQLRTGTDRSSFAVQLGAELRRAWDEHQATVARYETSRKEGRLSEVLLATAFGTPWPERLPELSWSNTAASFDYDAQIARLGATERVLGYVLGSRGAGDSLEIALDRCAELGSGCGTKAAQGSVLIALAEARPLKVGEKLEAIVDPDSRRGVVLFAYKTRPSARIVQVRGTRLGK